jgi:hypothetical protein
LSIVHEMDHLFGLTCMSLMTRNGGHDWMYCEKRDMS